MQDTKFAGHLAEYAGHVHCTAEKQENPAKSIGHVQLATMQMLSLSYCGPKFLRYSINCSSFLIFKVKFGVDNSTTVFCCPVLFSFSP